MACLGMPAVGPAPPAQHAAMQAALHACRASCRHLERCIEVSPQHRRAERSRVRRLLRHAALGFQLAGHIGIPQRPQRLLQQPHVLAPAARRGGEGRGRGHVG